ncbi:hypothetical protein AQUSIP_11230 [Aquicella siphonis]|uniref:Uncharacterized protein n=1 Tax=Aquicella siphonis TaxID=254247 RepID=A0A5E4PHM8_9COXI|nr:hypothetical protein AQUSIP_11230 [Aquicella siphonis]
MNSGFDSRLCAGMTGRCGSPSRRTLTCPPQDRPFETALRVLLRVNGGENPVRGEEDMLSCQHVFSWHPAGSGLFKSITADYYSALPCLQRLPTYFPL